MKVFRTDPFFLLQADCLLLKFFVMHLPNTHIAFYCAGPPLITHTSIICCTEYCIHYFSYLRVSHMAFLEFLQNSAVKIKSELYPHSCGQMLPHHRVSWNVSSPCLSVPVYMSATGLSISFPETVYLKKLPLFCEAADHFLLKCLLKTNFSLGPGLDKPLVKGLWCGCGTLGTWFSEWTWQSKANSWTWWS